ncbi:ABC transporter ATP-binding protein [Shimwellia pseudoproteus]|uniref:ABC transporter ATP-binding protein n=1 Tax=Shimwellia pseudoproteus TaxID=570012 RepID=UPI0018EB94E0|nr:ABC transporter ATP-binding protein [Shimwellia pseudoproteus]MBJ3815760.1 ABC transporter ATP-binding protein [Shimwellia pseudoproteus]
MSALRIGHLSAGYGKRAIIDNLSLPPLPAGSVTVLLGPNGCGKSTLLRALAGLNPARGEAWLGDNNLMALPFRARAREVVFLPQSLPQGVHLHVLESVIVARRASGEHDADHARQQAMQILEQLGIGHLALTFLDQLSGGQKQLVGLAQSLVRQPGLLLLDEPLSALDLHYQLQVMDLIARETAARQMVTLVVVHDINIAMRYGDTIVMLKDGGLVACGAPQAVITPATLAEVYGVSGRIECCSRGRPLVILDGAIAR